MRIPSYSPDQAKCEIWTSKNLQVLFQISLTDSGQIAVSNHQVQAPSVSAGPEVDVPGAWLLKETPRCLSQNLYNQHRVFSPTTFTDPRFSHALHLPIVHRGTHVLRRAVDRNGACLAGKWHHTVGNGFLIIDLIRKSMIYTTASTSEFCFRVHLACAAPELQGETESASSRSDDTMERTRHASREERLRMILMEEVKDIRRWQGASQLHGKGQSVTRPSHLKLIITIASRPRRDTGQTLSRGTRICNAHLADRT